MDSGARRIIARSEFEGAPIKGSRFPAYAAPVVSEFDAHSFVQSIRVASPGARHCAWAYRLTAEDYRSSDDGEPGGSAGRPILAQLEGASLVGSCVVVVRFSSGIKLGVGGLIRAYGGATRELLTQAETEVVVPSTKLQFRCAYSDQSMVERMLPDGSIEAREFDQLAVITARLPRQSVEALRVELLNLSSGRIEIVSLPDCELEPR